MAAAPDLDAALAALRQGGVIACPTEAVWGLSCDARQHAAVLRLLAIKQRPLDKGVIVVAAELETLADWLELSALPPSRLAVVRASWPGAHTWVLPASAQAPAWITGGRPGIAVRISAHPLLQRLCQAWAGPLVSTSANLAGQAPARRREELDPALLPALASVLDGAIGQLPRPTPIRDAFSGRALRS